MALVLPRVPKIEQSRYGSVKIGIDKSKRNGNSHFGFAIHCTESFFWRKEILTRLHSPAWFRMHFKDFVNPV